VTTQLSPHPTTSHTDRTLRWLALSLTPGVGAGRGRKLVELFDGIERLFSASLTELEAAGMPVAAAQSIALGKSALMDSRPISAPRCRARSRLRMQAAVPASWTSRARRMLTATRHRAQATGSAPISPASAVSAISAPPARLTRTAFSLRSASVARLTAASAMAPWSPVSEPATRVQARSLSPLFPLHPQ